MNHHHDHHGHVDSHEHAGSHLREAWQYLLSALWGFAFGGAQFLLVKFLASSYGAEGDASHTFADSSFILVSSLLAVWKHRQLHKHERIEKIGVIVQSGFFILAAVYIYLQIFFGNRHAALSPTFMFVAGLVGLVGNLVQAKVLGHAHAHGHGEDLSTHSETLKHIMYDVANSLVVMMSAVLAYISLTDLVPDPEIKFFAAVALVLACAAVVPLLKLFNFKRWMWIYVGTSGVVAGILSVMVASKEVNHIDVLVASVLALGMLANGLINLWKIKNM